MAAGLGRALGTDDIKALKRPSYASTAQPGTRIRNGYAIRSFSIELGERVRAMLDRGRFPLVVGGDCSVLLGCLYGARLAGGRGLIHVDGHSDFFHSGNYDTRARLGAAAGMDLALVTGRGEPVLTQWPGVKGALSSDADTIQIGERDALSATYERYYGDIVRTAITRFIIQDVLRIGVDETAARVIARLSAHDLDRVWLHVDLDVLDESVMPAVDSPGSPGLNFEQLGVLIRALVDSGRIIGLDVAIYDPERDPGGECAVRIVNMLEGVFARTG